MLPDPTLLEAMFWNEMLLKLVASGSYYCCTVTFAGLG